ncbi:PLD nuclease N-terminal domain-containing protein [Algoriphagus sp. CAU 1675]|uniref:PLD nuclease N-terminal domain-containing protein n=1 Tax=Algoriphagus sp. CAU 1675 TaxID=3032597 RepID=UPI0023DC2F09|nr:PLD nuclease N-terminal domain-containing protein [Algoriphagus sp. CAU 1675]MDF2156519.1 PLD nuclease N-terminal domain-containing protein [Algoriphagus sp. CAU 1675]
MNILFIQNIGGGPFLIFGLLYTVLWVYCLVDILRSNFKDPNMKLIWIIIILFAQVIGALVYLAIGKSTKTTLK